VKKKIVQTFFGGRKTKALGGKSVIIVILLLSFMKTSARNVTRLSKQTWSGKTFAETVIRKRSFKFEFFFIAP